MPSASGYIRHFDICNRHDLSRFVPLAVSGVRYGYVTKELAARLPSETGVFVENGDGLALALSFADFAARSAAMMQAARWISGHYGQPLRDEMYPVVEDYGDAPVAQIDRAAVPWFGVRAWGVHINGFVRKADGLHLWVGERSADRLAEPGKLDNMVGGGQPVGLTREENLCKEAHEEAGIDAALAMRATFARTLDYRVERNNGLRSDTLFIYDLELPEGFMPRNTDGEVAAFHLLPLAEAARLVRETDRFKFNCTLVVADFLVRHGFIGPDDAEYAALKQWLG
ncbi:MAG: DUF4743 domain-containing protein [Alphaproteobacteria bacterium]|nr:DUF4743 domain-containing protein [Alphaproteobacteria bacterium]